MGTGGQRDRRREEGADILIKVPTNFICSIRMSPLYFPPDVSPADRTGILSQLELSGIDPP